VRSDNMLQIGATSPSATHNHCGTAHTIRIRPIQNQQRVRRNPECSPAYSIKRIHPRLLGGCQKKTPSWCASVISARIALSTLAWASRHNIGCPSARMRFLNQEQPRCKIPHPRPPVSIREQRQIFIRTDTADQSIRFQAPCAIGQLHGAADELPPCLSRWSNA